MHVRVDVQMSCVDAEVLLMYGLGRGEACPTQTQLKERSLFNISIALQTEIMQIPPTQVHLFYT